MSKDLTEALRVLTEQANGGAQQPAAMSDRGAAARATGSALLGGASQGGSPQGGIASPLTETAYGDRTWYAERTIASSDGIWSLKIKPLKSIKLTDANSAEVVINLKNRP
jgi:hypothetical protein